MINSGSQIISIVS